ncbi:MAG: alpha-2-macroglobulin family protein [bacterium]
MLACLVTAPRVSAQDSLRVLRVQPSAPASPTAPLVVTFDHPIAPRLDASLSPEGVLRVTPTASMRVFWRDPSTIVAEFDSPWAMGSQYTVRIDPALRSANGLPLAVTPAVVVRMQLPKLMVVVGSAAGADLDTIVRPAALYTGGFDPRQLTGHAWFVPRAACGGSDSLPLAPVAIRPLAGTDSYALRDGGGYDRDKRLDSLRRVVDFALPRSLARGCVGELHVPTTIGEAGVTRQGFSIRPPFTLTSVTCATEHCEPGNILIRFSNPVSVDEIRAHVRVDGRPARVGEGRPEETAMLLDSLRPRQQRRITIDASLRNTAGERLVQDTTLTLTGSPVAPSVGFATGRVTVPRDAQVLLRVRHMNTDSVIVVLARVPEGRRAGALAGIGSPDLTLKWKEAVGDSIAIRVATPAPEDSDAVFVVPTTWIPAAWRDDPLLLVRAMPAERIAPLVRSLQPNTVPPIVVRVLNPYADGPRFALVTRSNIATQALSAHGSMDIWVTALRTAQAMPGAVVTLRDDSLHALASATTDARGRAHIEHPTPASRWRSTVFLDVVSGADRTFLFVDPNGMRTVPEWADNDNPVFARLLGAITAANGLHGVAFSERGIYRPGEHVFLDGSMRRFTAGSGYRTPAGDSAQWTVHFNTPDFSVDRVWSHAGRLSQFGTLPDSFLLDRTARLGSYSATLALRVGKRWLVAGSTEFRVAEYRAPEFVVRMDGVATTPVFAGDTVPARVDARYLFGLPLAGGAVHWWTNTRELSPWELHIPALVGYSVGRSGWRRTEEGGGSGGEAQGDGTTPTDGSLTLRIPTRVTDHPVAMTITASVTDVNRQAVNADTTITVHAANAYVGLRTRTRRWAWSADDSIPFELLVARPDGSTRVGDTVRIIAHRLRWLENRVVRDTVWRTTTVSAAAPVSVTFRPDAGGSYEIIAEVRDERGRRSITGLDVWVTGAGVAWGSTDPRLIAVRSDRTRYAPGDTAELVVPSPSVQRAWVQVRREGLLSEQFVVLKEGANVIRVPIPDVAAPRADIRITAVRPLGAEDGEDSTGVYVRNGTLSIEVDTAPRALHVIIAPERLRYAPRETVRMRVSVRDVKRRGRRAELAVWAVDEGVVSLTAFTRPAMLALLLGQSNNNQWFGSNLLAYMLATAPPVGPWLLTTVDYFGNGVVAGSPSIRLRGVSSMSVSQMVLPKASAPRSTDAPVRSAFATTPFFAGTIRTDANGVATTRFTLPDNVTTYRIFAAAVGDDIYAGSGDTTIITTRPLVARAAMPRVVRTGDELYAGAVVTQDVRGRTPVDLTVTALGVSLPDGGRVRDTLVDRRSREVRVPMRVTATDSVSLVFRARSHGRVPMGDAVEVRLAVSPPGRARAHVVTGMLEQATDVTLAVPDGTDTLRSHVELYLGASPLPLVRQLSDALRIYPYECTEQISSAGRALLARLRLERAIDSTAVPSARDRTQLEVGVATLVNRQRDDGGFGYWSAENWTTPWLTAYALQYVMGARDAGVAVPDGVIHRAQSYLATTMQSYRNRSGEPGFTWSDSLAWPHDALAAATMLRRAGVPDTTLESYVDSLRQQLGFEDRLALAAILASRHDTVAARQLLEQAWRAAHVEGRRVVLDDSTSTRHWLFRSVTRPAAALLATTARLAPAHPLLGALFESVVQSGRSETTRWWNTLDQAAVAEALVAAAAPMGLSRERQVAVGGPHGSIATVTVARGKTDSVHLALSALRVGGNPSASLHLTLASPERTPTYYAMTLFEVPDARPVRADESGIGVERWYETYDGGKAVTEVREGDLVRVRLRITVPADREFVVIDDALPAGLEAIDLTLRTSSAIPPFTGAPRLRADMQEGPPGQHWWYGSWDAGWWTPWEHKEIRDDRVLYFARQLWKGSYQASYVARATTAGTFVRPPAQAEEMYNPAVRGRSDGGVFTVTRAPK